MSLFVNIFIVTKNGYLKTDSLATQDMEPTTGTFLKHSYDGKVNSLTEAKYTKYISVGEHLIRQFFCKGDPLMIP